MNLISRRTWMASLGGALLLLLLLLLLLRPSTPPAPPAPAAPVRPALAATTAQLSVARAHRQPIASLAWSSDGRLLLSASLDNTARLWQVDNGALLRLFPGTTDTVRGRANHQREAIFVQHDRRALIAGSNGTRLWNLADGKLVAILDPATDMVSAIAANDTAQIVASAGNGRADNGARLFLRLHDLARGAVRELAVTDVGAIASIALSPDGNRLALAGSRITGTTPGGMLTAPLVRVIDLRDGRVLLEVRELGAEADWVRFDGAARIVYRSGTQVFVQALAGGPARMFAGLEAALAADGSLLALAPDSASESEDDHAATAAEVYDPRTGRHLASLPWAGARHERMRNRVAAYAFRPDGRQLAIGFRDGKVAVWDRQGQAYARIWPAQPVGAHRLRLTDRAGKRAAMPTPNGVAIWDLDKGERIEIDLPFEPSLIAVSPDGKSVFATAPEKSWMWDGATGIERWNSPGMIDHEDVAAFHPTRDILATAGYSAVYFSRISSTEFVRKRAEGFHGIAALDFSADGKLLAIGDELGEVRILPALKGKPLSTIGAPGINAAVSALIFSRDGSRLSVAYGNGYNRTLVYDTASGKKLLECGTHAAAINALAADGADRFLVSGGEDNTAILWDCASGKEIARLPHSGEVRALSLSTDGKRLFSYADYAMHAWDVSTLSRPTEMLAFFELPFRRWAVVDPVGRFDANDLETGNALHWLIADAPLRALPPEIFMRDYFEPRLAARTMGCHEAQDADSQACAKAFNAQPPVATLNRVQPRVEILGVAPAREPGQAQVRVAITAVSDPTQTNGKTVSGAYDLRLFRDGQLVARWPDPASRCPYDQPGRSAHDGSAGISKELAGWRHDTCIPLPAGTARVTLPFTVRLPSARQARNVVFTAYAFNDDRVRSATATQVLPLPATPLSKLPRAYVITVGVNGYQAASRNLSFAVNDARVMTRALGKLEGYELVPLTLTSEAEPRTWTATKDNIREVLHRLAGGAPHPGSLIGVTGAERLARASPDDLFILSFSGHGHTEPDGSFYMLAADSGPLVEKMPDNRLPPAALAHFISSEELSDWLAPVDAGQMALIIDTCHSGGVVEQPGFKPGPMGDRGFGQLAYDKAMLILAAAQRDDVAIESTRLQQGLLTYALVHDGFLPVWPEAPELQADHDRNRELTLVEWLAYGAWRVPGLYADVRSGLVTVDYLGKDPDPGEQWRDNLVKRAQTPALFNFTRGRASAVIARHVPEPLPPGVLPLPDKIERRWVPYPKDQ